jgi:hypothetical protein
MKELFNKAVGLIGLGFMGYVLFAMLVGIVKAMFSSGTGTSSGSRASSRHNRFGNNDEVQWYDKSRP